MLSIPLTRDPARKEAAASLARVRREEDAATRATVARDGFTRAAALASDADTKRVAGMVTAAAGATTDAQSTAGIYEAGLRALTSGVSASGGFLAGLALDLMQAGYRNDRSQNRTQIARASLGALEASAPDARLQQQVELVRRTADAANYYDSSIAAYQAGLKRIKFAEGPIGATLALIIPQAFSNRALARKMASRGLKNQPVDDRHKMATEALAVLEKQGDAVGSLASRVVAGMRFSNTSRDAALAALSLTALPLPDWFRATLSPGALPKAAGKMLSHAYVGEDRGRWVDEKTTVASTALACIGGGDRHKALAASIKDMVDNCAFSRSSERIAKLGFKLLGTPDPSDAKIARAFRRMTGTAISGDDSSYRYRDDQSVVAKKGAAFFAAHATSEHARKWGDLATTVLAPGKFTKSNVGMARTAFSVVALGLHATDANVARVLQRMVKTSLNAESSTGRYQADKSTVVNTARPWLHQNLKDPASQKILRLWDAAMQKTTFAATDEGVSHVALNAIARGDASDSKLGRLAAAMTKKAYAGTSSSWAYEDDKTGIAIRAAEFLQKEGTEQATRDWADFALKALDRITFTRTATDVSRVAFKRIAAGDTTDDRALGAAAHAMTRKALSAQTSSYKFVDDKSVVAVNCASWIAARPVAPTTALLAAATTSAINACHWAKSCEAAADAGFKAIARGARTRKQAASAILGMINGGVVSNVQDKGPIAVAVAHALAVQETKHDRSRLALDTLAAMMNTDADYRERVKTAQAGLRAWAGGDDSKPLDPYAWARDLSAVSHDPTARVRMLAEAVKVLARDKGQNFMNDAEAEVSAARHRADAPSGYSSLLSYLDKMEKRPSEKETVEKMVEVINNGPGADAPKVEVSDEYVVIGGVRVKKKS